MDSNRLWKKQKFLYRSPENLNHFIASLKRHAIENKLRNFVSFCKESWKIHKKGLERLFLWFGFKIVTKINNKRLIFAVYNIAIKVIISYLGCIDIMVKPLLNVPIFIFIIEIIQTLFDIRCVHRKEYPKVSLKFKLFDSKE